jgi:Amt family ammonium transporter
MYMIGTFILAFGWFGFNAGSTLAGADSVIGRAAANTMLASAAGALTSMVYMWLVYKKPDPSFMCNGMLAGLVAITAPCAFVAPWAAVVIGGIAGVLVIWSCLFVEKTLKVDDPVGAISVHGVNGAWGVLALGLFADGTYGTAGWNGVFLYEIQGKLQWMSKALSADEMKTLGATVKGVTGLFYGNPSQFLAEAIGAIANVLWVFPVAYGFFWVLEKVVGNRVKPEDEVEGLDIPEMGVQGYINEETQPVEGTAAIPVHEPRPAAKPPNGVAHFVVKVQGASEPELMNAWSELCKPNASPPSTDFLAVYPRMTTVSGFQFHFRAGDPKETSVRLVKLLQERMPGKELSGSIVT